MNTDVLVEGKNLSNEAQLSSYISTVGFFFNSKEFVFECNQLYIKRIWERASDMSMYKLI